MASGTPGDAARGGSPTTSERASAEETGWRATDPGWTRLKELFDEALGLDAGRRAALLERVADTEPDLSTKLAAMLAADAAEDDFLAPAEGGDADAAPAEEDEHGALAGLLVDRYRVLHRIGRGGMGEVYLAERTEGETAWRVALKVLKRGVDTESIQRRFAVERRVLAALDHPGICRLLDAGALPDGRPYFVMEHVEGRPIDEHCDAERLTVRERLWLFREVCAAVQFAHGRLVVHRDIKPANVLVTAEGRPKLLDFGIAKLLEEDAAGLTATGGWDRPMTVEYASPEQVEGGPTTTATDVYSLGVLLYELLTGHPPFAAETRRELERSVLEREPPRPSTAVGRTVVVRSGPRRGTTLTPLEVGRARSERPAGLRRALSGDLDTIVLTALQKEPARRYASVDLLSQDVQRFLDGLPVQSRRPTLAYRAGKFVRRNKALSAAGAALVLALAGGTAGTTWKAIEAGRARDAALTAQARVAAARDRAESEREIAEEVTRFLQELLESATPGEGDRDVSVREVLVRAADRIEATFAGRPAVRSAVSLTLARAFLGLGELERAAAQADAAVATREGLAGAGDVRLAEALIQQGSVRYARGELASAAASLERALELVSAAEAPDPESVALVLNNLGAVRRTAGAYEEAERLFAEALDLREAARGRGSLEVAESLNNLAGAVHVQGRLEEAEELLRESLAIRRVQLAPDHPLLLQSVSNLAVLHAAQGAFDRAEPLLVESVAASREVLGPDHPDLARDLSNLASVLQHLGRLEEAEQALRECLAIRRRAVPGSPLVPLTALSLGRVLLERDRLDEAEEILLGAAPEILGFEPGATDYAATLLGALVELSERRGDDEAAAHWRAQLERRSR